MNSDDPVAPFQPLLYHGNSIKVDTKGKTVVVPTGNPTLLPRSNEYINNSNLLSIKDSPYGGVKGAYPPDYDVGTVLINSGDGVYLTDVNGNNTSKVLSAGKQKEIGAITIDTAARTITSEFIIKNTSPDNSPTVVDDCSVTTGWGLGNGTGTISLSSGHVSVSGNASATGSHTIMKGYSLSGLTARFIKIKVKNSQAGNIRAVVYSSDTEYTYFSSSRFPLAANTVTTYVLPLYAPLGSTGQLPYAKTAGYSPTSIYRIAIGIEGVTNSSANTFEIYSISLDGGKWANVECFVPDKLINTSKAVEVFTYRGSAYISSVGIQIPNDDSSVDNNSSTNDNVFFLDGTGLDNIVNDPSPKYNHTGLAGYRLGNAGETYTDCTYGGSANFTYSSPGGAKKRVGFSILMPPSDGGRTRINECRVKVVTHYDDLNKSLTTLMDYSGNRNNGTLYNVSRVSEKYLGFDGSTSYAMATVPNYIDNFSFVIELSVGTFANIVSGDVNRRVVIQRINSQNVWQLTLNPTGGFIFQVVRGGVTYAANVSTGYTTGTFYRIVGTYSAANGIKFYINGTRPTAQGAGLSSGNVDNTFIIGRRSDGTGNFQGNIKQLMIFNRELSADEVTSDYAGGNISSSMLVANWKLSELLKMGSSTYELSDDSSASTGLYNMAEPWIAVLDKPTNRLYNKAGVTAKGTIYNGTYIYDKNGAANGATRLNGIDSYISIPTDASLTVTNGNSISIAFQIHQLPVTGNWMSLLSPQSGSLCSIGLSESIGIDGTPWCFTCGPSGSRMGALVNNLSLDTWYRLTVVYKSDGNVTVYINDVDVTVNVGDYWSASSAETTIGCRDNGRQFNGAVADYIKYNRELTQADVSNIVQGSIPVTGLVAHYTTESVSSDIDFYLLDERPKALNFKRDESGEIYELELFPGNGNVNHGRIKYSNIIRDTDSDGIPDCLDPDINGSVAKFLKQYDFAKDWYYEHDLSTSAIQTNDFSITANSLDIIPFVVSEGDSVSTANNVVLPVAETVATATGNVSIVDVRGQSAVRVRDTPYTNAGECKVWDTVTDGNTNESTWKRVYSTDWVFTGDCVVENGIIRLKLNSSSGYFYVYTGSGYTLLSEFYPVKKEGLSLTISNFRIVANVSGSVDSRSFTHTITFDSGIPYSIINSHSPDYDLTFYTNNRFAVRHESGSYVPYDAVFYSNVSSLPNLYLTSPVHLTFNPAGRYIAFIVPHTTYLDGSRHSSSAVWTHESTYGTDAVTAIGAIPFDCSKLYYEAESLRDESTTLYTGSDAYPFTGNTGVVVSNRYTGIHTTSFFHNEFPNGTYTFYVRCKRNAGTGNDLTLCIRTATEIDGTTYKNITTTSSPVGSFGYVSSSFTITNEIRASGWKLWVEKSSADGVNPITIDYILVVPTGLIEKHAKRALWNAAPATRTLKSSTR